MYILRLVAVIINLLAYLKKNQWVNVNTPIYNQRVNCVVILWISSITLLYSLGLRLEAAYTNFPSPNKSKAVGTKEKSFIYQLTQLGPVISFIF